MTRSDFQLVLVKLNDRLGRFPMIKEIADDIGTKAYLIPPMLKKLAESGFLMRIGNNYRLAPESAPAMKGPNAIHVRTGIVSTPEVKEEQEQETFLNVLRANPPEDPKPLAPIIEAPADPVLSPKPSWLSRVQQLIPPRKALTVDPFKHSLSFLRWLLLIIGSGSVIGSIWYTAIYEQLSNPVWLSWLLSSIMVTFSTAAFDIVIAMVSGAVTRSWARWLVAAGFLGLWLVVISFSIASTIGGQYKQHAQLLITAKGSSTDMNQAADLVELKNAKDSADAELKLDRLALTNLIQNQPKPPTDLKELANYRTTFNNVQAAITAQQEACRQATLNAEAARTALQQYVQDHPTARALAAQDVPDFYKWVEGIFNINADRVQFWMNLFPAVFLDIIAPTSLALFLFMRKREEKSA